MTTLDSAGVRIVESSAPSWETGEEWSLSAEPVVRIGTVGGDRRTQLFQVRDAARLDDGRLVVVNAGADELRLYSAGGELLRTIGRRGDGPGELQDPTRLWVLPDDTLVVADWTRISIFDSTGDFVRSDVFGPWAPVDRFADGRFLRIVIPPGVDKFLPGYFHPDEALVRTTVDGSESDTLAYVAGGELYRWSDGRGTSSWRSPFGRVRMAVAHGDSIYTADGATFEIRHLDPGGDPDRIIRRSADPREVTDGAIERLEATYLENAASDEQRTQRRRMFREWTYPKLLPTWDRLMLDRDGNVWTREYVVDEREASRWSVHGRQGAWLGDVDMPARFIVFEIGSDYVLGVHTDDLGVEYVVSYALDKRGH